MKYIFIIVNLFCGLTLLGQNQRIADSLISLYQNEPHRATDFNLLLTITKNLADPAEKIKYTDIVIDGVSGDSIDLYLFKAYLEKGNALVKQGDYDEALSSYLTSLSHAQRNQDKGGEGQLLISIADTYSIIGNSRNAEDYYKRGIAILREGTDSISLGSALLNAGDEAYNIGKYELALEYFDESGKIFEEQNFLLGKAYNLGNIGMVYAKQGKTEVAEENMNRAIDILEDLGDHYPISVYLMSIADIYADQDNWDNAINYVERSLELSSNYGLKDQISEAYLQLSTLYENKQNQQKALEYYREHIALKDSLKNLETIEEMADLRTEFEVSQKQSEVDLLEIKNRNQKVAIIGIGIVLLLISIMAYMLNKRNKEIERSHQVIEKEKNKSEQLLLNILPAGTADELKKYGKVKARKFENVTVMFTDFVNFTEHSQSLSPEEIVNSVDFYFSKFDEIIERHNLEKIKTIGDAYMAVGGLPFQTDNSAINTAQAAIEIAEFVESVKIENKDSLVKFDMRIGLNTGDVVAGVVGTKKFAYDIWGDTVNIASRMESLSETGKINLSESTYQAVKNYFNCSYRGDMEVRNKGKMKMYFLLSQKL